MGCDEQLTHRPATMAPRFGATSCSTEPGIQNSPYASSSAPLRPSRDWIGMAVNAPSADATSGMQIRRSRLRAWMLAKRMAPRVMTYRECECAVGSEALVFGHKQRQRYQRRRKGIVVAE